MARATPRRRRLLGTLAAVVVAAAGVAGLAAFFQSRDDAALAPGGGPGRQFPDLGARHVRRGERNAARYNSDPPTSGPHVAEPVRRDAATLSDDQLLHALEQGNVVLVYGTGSPPAALRALQDELSGPFDPALAAAGQAVILARRAGTRGVVALAWRRLERAATPTDPRLGTFAEHWLGAGARG